MIINVLRREFRRLRTTPAPWLVAMATAFASGIVFLVQLNTSWEWDLTGLVTFMSYILLFTAPALTMGVIAGEREQGTWQLLRSDPISAQTLVLGKFTASFGYYLIVVVLTAGPALWFIADRGGDFDAGRQGAAIIAHILMAALYLAVGLAVSAHCSSALVAFFGSFIILLAFILLGGVGSAITGEWGRRLAIDPHLHGFALGVVPWKDLAFFGSGIFIFLFLAIRGVVIEGTVRRLAITSVGWLVLWALLQGHFEKLTGSIDVSVGQVSRPSVDALSRLEGRMDGVELSVIWTASDPHEPLVSGYCDALVASFAGATVRHLDLDGDNAAVMELLRIHDIDPYQVMAPGGLLVSVAGRSEFVAKSELIQELQSPGRTRYRRWRVEFALVRAVLGLQQRLEGAIALISAAGSELEGSRADQLSFDRLRAEGYQVEIVTPAELDASRHTVAFFCNPTRAWTDIAPRLAEYRHQGGRLVLCLEPGGHDEKGPISPTARVITGFSDQNPETVPGFLSEEFKRSYGDFPVLMKSPLAFEAPEAEALIKAYNVKPVGVQGGNLIKIGDVDWLRRVLQHDPRFVNGLALVYIVQKLTGNDAHFRVQMRDLDLQVAKLDKQTENSIELWMLKLIPGFIALMFALHSIKRRWL